METIVELFTGFLDSGKTTLIREALHSPDFLTTIRPFSSSARRGMKSTMEAWLKKNGIIKYVVDEEERSMNSSWKAGTELPPGSRND